MRRSPSRGSTVTGLALILVAALGTGGCDAEPPPPAALEAPLILPAPLRESYVHSCAFCHEVGSSSAPRTGDRAAWAELLEKGMDALVDHTIDGYNDMPPLGQCMECSLEDFEALVRWMAQSPEPET